MNIQVLNELMKLNGITSYFNLSQKIDIPYTTLLDLIRGKGEKISNIKLIANYFNVSMSYLIEEPRKIITINENNSLVIEKETGYNSLLSNLLSN